VSSCQDWPTGKHTAIFSTPVGELVWSPIKELLLYCNEFNMYSLKSPTLSCGGRIIERTFKNGMTHYKVNYTLKVNIQRNAMKYKDQDARLKKTGELGLNSR
jgi:hypothetical protein